MKVFAYCFTDPLVDPVVMPQFSPWVVDQVYQDIQSTLARAKVRSSGVPLRPQWSQLLLDCHVSPPDYLVVRRFDELGDTLDEVSQHLKLLNDLGITLVATESDPSLNSAEGDRRPHMLLVLREIQRIHHSRRIRQGHARNRVKALPPPGKAPYGYRRGKDRYVLDRSTAPIVKEFFEQFLLYGSLRGAVRYMGKRYGKKISVTTGRRWLTNPVYRGNLAYRDGRILTQTHQPILAPEEAAQIDRLLRRNRPLAPRSASAPRSLAGIVRCHGCQSVLKVTRTTSPRKAQEYLYLRSPDCPHVPKCRALAYNTVLEQTIQAICQELPRAVAILDQPAQNPHKQALEQAIAQKRAILEQIPHFLAEGIFDEETAILRGYALQTDIAKLQTQLAQLSPVNLQEIVQAVAIPQFWRDLSEPERRFFFREFIQQIEIHRFEGSIPIPSCWNDSPQSWELRLIFMFEGRG